MNSARHFSVDHNHPTALPAYYDVETVRSSPQDASRRVMRGERISSDGIQIVRAFDIPCASFSNLPAHRRAPDGARFMLAIATHAQVVQAPAGKARWHTPHDLIVLDTSEPWEVRVSRTKMSTVMTVADDLIHQVISRDELRKMLARTSPSNPTSLMSAAMDTAWMLAKAGRLADAGPRMLRSIVDLLWLMTVAAGREDERAAGALGLELRREQFKACIHRRYTEPGLTTADVARELNISTRYLRRAFAEIDCAPARYLHDFRLDASAELLKDAASSAHGIIDIALACGFSSAAHFSTEFRRRFGLSPREFRLMHAASQSGARIQRRPID